MGNSTDRLPELVNLAFVALLCWWTATIEPASQSQPGLKPAALLPCAMDRAGFVRGQLFGAVQRVLNWSGDAMLCDGMLRPDSDGVRLVFSESAARPGAGLRLVIGITGMSLGVSAGEQPANVTLIDQDNGVFYSTQGLERCWAEVVSQARLADPEREAWRIDGKLYCVGALAAVDGPESVTLGDIDFSGRVAIGPDTRQ